MPLQHAFHVDWMARQHTMSDSINIAEMSAEDLQRRLAERNRLVEELTSRLEQAAEQLDRLRRSGADRGSRALGIPPELIEQQKSLTEELQNAVQQWEDMQPTELLARVEMQVGELRDLIVDRLDKAVLPVPSVAGADLREVATTNRQPEPPKTIKPAPKSQVFSSYEAFKAGLLDAGVSEAPADEPPSAADAAPFDEPKQEPKTREYRPVEIPAVDPPTTVDLAAATLDDLRVAVDERDSYIAYLIRRLRAAEAPHRPAGNWSDLDGVPDELRTRLEEHERKLQESLRMAEVETSLERARLAREAARLEILDEQLRKKAVQLGIAVEEPDESAEHEVAAERATAKKNGRWSRLFGK
jgi:hypothetical protein